MLHITAFPSASARDHNLYNWALPASAHGDRDSMTESKLHVPEQHPCSGGAYGSAPFAGAPHTVGNCDESAGASTGRVTTRHHTLRSCLSVASPIEVCEAQSAHANVPSGPSWLCSNVSSCSVSLPHRCYFPPRSQHDDCVAR
jgi:hypothetical protein